MPQATKQHAKARLQRLLPMAAGLALLLGAVPVQAQESAEDLLDLRGPVNDGIETPTGEIRPPAPPPDNEQRERLRAQPAAKLDAMQRATRAQPIGPVSDAPRTGEQDAFAAPGIRTGGFVLRPSVETGITATSNANSSPGGGSAVLSETTLQLNAVTDRAADPVELNAYGTFEKSVSGEELEQKEAGIDITIIRDLANDYRLRGFASYAIRPESFDSPVEVIGAVDQPIQQSLRSSVDLSREAGKLRLGIGADLDREWYGDAELPDGTEISQSDRDNTLTTARLRAGFEISPALTPFAELRAGRRSYDERTDAAGYARSADHFEASAGLAFDRGEKFWGELALGYVRETPDDDRLAPIDGLSASADINWSPVRGTNVNLLGQTQIEGTTTPGLSGSILYSGLVTIERQMRANLTGSLAAGIGYRDYQPGSDHDTIYSAEAAATWWLNRYLGLTARARHENLNSTVPGRDTTTNSIYFGVKARR